MPIRRRGIQRRFNQCKTHVADISRLTYTAALKTATFKMTFLDYVVKYFLTVSGVLIIVMTEFTDHFF